MQSSCVLDMVHEATMLSISANALPTGAPSETC